MHGKTLLFSCAISGLLALSACTGGEEGDDALSETELGNVDVQEGTISDDMIQPDSASEAATEAAEADAEAQQKVEAEQTQSETSTPEASEEKETTAEAGDTDE